jgi:hypothetical protein
MVVFRNIDTSSTSKEDAFGDPVQTPFDSRPYIVYFMASDPLDII